MDWCTNCVERLTGVAGESCLGCNLGQNLDDDDNETEKNDLKDPKPDSKV